MIDVYRGFPYPDIRKEDGWFYATDERIGWFDGPTRSDVFQHWKNAVDHEVRQLLLESGRYNRYSGDIFGCQSCGAVVFDILLHEKEHEG